METKLLVEDRSAEKARQLLFLDGIARENQDVTETRENKSGDAAFEGLKESEFSLGEIKSDVRLADLDAILGGDRVDSLTVEAKGIESGKSLAWGGISAKRIGRSCRTRRPEPTTERQRERSGTP